MSKKKRDTYLSAANSGNNPSPEGPVIRGNPISIKPTTQNQGFMPNFHAFVYSPSFRFLSANPGQYIAARTATKPYYVGLKETYTFYPNDNSLWFWRRIVFTSKRQYANEISATAASQTGVESTVGATTQRPFRDISGDASTVNYGNLYTKLVEDLFEGIYGTDWVDPIRAKIDKSRVTRLSDTRRQLSSHNDIAKPCHIKTYTSMKKTLVYADEENGSTMSVSPFSVTSKSGMGNIYVMDFFNCPVPVSVDSTFIRIGSESTLYWHEK